MDKADVLVVGGGPAAVIAALTAKSNNPGKEVTMLRNYEDTPIPCGIPYVFGTLEEVKQNFMPDMPLEKAKIPVKVGQAASIDREKKICKTEAGDEIQYDRLIIATGSNVIIPKWLEGANLEGVYTIEKNNKKIAETKEALAKVKKVVVIGGGFIGVECADELNKAGKDVTIVEVLPHILSLAFDDEIAERAENTLKERGVKVAAGSGVKKITGDKKATGVVLNDGTALEADAVVLAMGYRPNSDIAKDAGLKLNDKGFIKVDEYMRTSDDSIFAAGDCAGKKDFNTKKLSMIMLASTATTEARIAGINVFNINPSFKNEGTLAVFATALGNKAYGVAGITEAAAKKEGIDIVTGCFEDVDRHPGKLPGASPLLVKLIVSKQEGVVIGGSVCGGPSVGEIVNIMGFMIQNKMNVKSIFTAQIGTHPLLTTAPTKYPLVKAAEIIVKSMKS